jgi:hypothetical protein
VVQFVTKFNRYWINPAKSMSVGFVNNLDREFSRDPTTLLDPVKEPFD